MTVCRLMILNFLISCTLLLTSATSLADDRDDEETCFKGERGVKKFQACLRLAQKDDYRAMLRLVMLYEEGAGVAKDELQAKYWREKESVTKRYVAPDDSVPVNISKSDERFLDAVGLVGTDKRGWLKTGWGSGFLISKCHVLTANHVVFGIGGTRIDHIRKTSNAEPMVLGKEVLVGFGQLEKSPWKSDIVIGKVVGFDSEYRRAINGEEFERDNSNDWTLLKLDRGVDGKYSGEKITPFCLHSAGSHFKTQDAAKINFRAVGHPGDKFILNKKLVLWQDEDCKVVIKEGQYWGGTCRAQPGMSGGPLIYYKTNGNDSSCWTAAALISSESDMFSKDFTSFYAPLNDRLLEKIEKAMKDNPCE